MALKRLIYLAAGLAAVVFYIAHGEWLSFVVLLFVLGLPWLSLLLTLPAIFRFRAGPSGPTAVEMGQDAPLWLLGKCVYPMPPFRGRLRLRRHITGEQWRYRTGRGLLTDHCGGITVTAEQVRVCDYLGLFAFPVAQKDPVTILVRPKPLPLPLPADLQRHIALSWKPKFGGGFAENHELRLYRPGDSLNHVHWKLSAKTGKLILRQPMEPNRGRMLLTMNLKGTPEEVDRKFGRLLWLGRCLLEAELAFQIRALTGQGILAFDVASPEALEKAIDALLCCSAVKEGDLRLYPYAAAWQYHIGGDADET